MDLLFDHSILAVVGSDTVACMGEQASLGEGKEGVAASVTWV